MGIWDKIKKSDFDDDEDEIEETGTESTEPEKVSNPSAAFGRGAGSAALELKVVRPESYDTVDKIADHLLNRKTVVLNLEATNKETAKRLIDFLSGVAYSINGTIRRVATNTFVLTPSNVGITGEALGNETPKTAPKTESADDFVF